MSIEAMKQALEALERSVATCFDQYAHQQAMSQPDHFINQSITSLRQAIAEAEKQTSVSEVEPVGWMHTSGNAAYTGKNCNVLGYTVPLYTHPQPKREPLTEWKPIETAPKDTEVLLYCNKFIPLYIGKKRYGCLGEPQQDEFEWRCSSSGRFANPTYWMPLPKSPIEAAYGIKE